MKSDHVVKIITYAHTHTYTHTHNRIYTDRQTDEQRDTMISLSPQAKDEKEPSCGEG